jgi:hypothetical protein
MWRYEGSAGEELLTPSANVTYLPSFSLIADRIKSELDQMKRDVRERKGKRDKWSWES